MSIIDIIIKKRLKYEQRIGSILYRMLAPLKLVIIVGITVLILRFQFSGNLLENSTTITILTIMIIVGIIYSFDFLYVIAYVIAKKSSKYQIIKKKYEMDKSIRKMRISKRKFGKYKHEMEESKQALEQIELIKEKELSNELEQIPKLIEEKQYLIVKDKLEKILQKSKQYHLNTIQTNAQAEYNKYKKFWK